MGIIEAIIMGAAVVAAILGVGSLLKGSSRLGGKSELRKEKGSKEDAKNDEPYNVPAGDHVLRGNEVKPGPNGSVWLGSGMFLPEGTLVRRGAYVVKEGKLVKNS